MGMVECLLGRQPMGVMCAVVSERLQRSTWRIIVCMLLLTRLYCSPCAAPYCTAGVLQGVQGPGHAGHQDRPRPPDHLLWGDLPGGLLHGIAAAAPPVEGPYDYDCGLEPPAHSPSSGGAL